MSNASGPCHGLSPSEQNSLHPQPSLIVIDQQRFVHELIAFRYRARALYRLEAMRELEALETLSCNNAQLLIDTENIDLREYPGSLRSLSDGRLRRIFKPFANQILLFTNNTDRKLTQRFLGLGASGLLHKAACSELLLETLARLWIKRPSRPITRAAQRPRRNRIQQATSHSRVVENARFSRRHLSRRQCEVLAMLERGLPNKSISAELDLSLSTVKTHVSAILKALGAINRSQAAFKASSSGFARTARLAPGEPDGCA